MATYTVPILGPAGLPQPLPLRRQQGLVARNPSPPRTLGLAGNSVNVRYQRESYQEDCTSDLAVHKLSPSEPCNPHSARVLETEYSNPARQAKTRVHHCDALASVSHEPWHAPRPRASMNRPIVRCTSEQKGSKARASREYT